MTFFGERPAETRRQLASILFPGRLAVGFSRDGRPADALFLLLSAWVRSWVVQALGRTRFRMIPRN